MIILPVGHTKLSDEISFGISSFNFVWGNISFVLGSRPEFLQSSLFSAKNLSSATYLSISTEGSPIEHFESSSKIIISLPSLLPTEETRAEAFACYRNHVVDEVLLRIFDNASGFCLCPVLKGRTFYFQEEDRNSIKNSVIEGASFEWGCESRDERNCWLSIKC